jgi:hypothetical protein
MSSSCPKEDISTMGLFCLHRKTRRIPLIFFFFFWAVLELELGVLPLEPLATSF